MKVGEVCIVLMLCLALLALSGCGREDDGVDRSVTAGVATTTGPSSPPSVSDPSQVLPENTDDDSIFIDMKGADLSPYDGTTLNGTSVRDALKLFRNSNVAVLVATQMVMDGTVAMNEFDGNVDPAMPRAGVKGIDTAVSTSGEVLSDKLSFINYGALLKDPSGKGVVLEYKDGRLIAKDGLVGNEKVNLNDTNAFTEGFAEYIADYLRMRAYLVVNAENEVIGIAFHAVPFK